MLVYALQKNDYWLASFEVIPPPKIVGSTAAEVREKIP